MGKWMGGRGLAAITAAAMFAWPAWAQVPQIELEIEVNENQTVDEKADGYWIGVRLEPVSPLLKSQLNVEHGLAVAQVVDDGPAKGAGVEENDILLSVDGAAAADPGVVVDLVNKTQGQKIKVDLLRQGKRRTIEITPMPRPEMLQSEPQRQRLQRWLEAEQKRIPHLKDGAEKDFWFFRPGVLLPEGAARIEVPSFMLKGGEFPANTRIEINKQGDGPAKITVRYNGQTWEIDENGVDQLPGEVRSVVERALGKLTLSSLEVDVEPLRLWAGKKRQAAAEAASEAAAEAADAARLRFRERRDELVKKRDDLQRKALQAIGESEIPDHLSDALQRMEEAVQSLQQSDVLENIERELKALRRDVEQLKKEARGEQQSDDDQGAEE